MKLALTALAIACACFAAGVAHAEPGGVSGVGGPGVTKGEITAEVRTAVFSGNSLDGSWLHRMHTGRGLTDWWRLTVVLRASDPMDDSSELTSVGLENVFDLTRTRNWPVHLGARLEYKFGLNGADDEFAIAFLAEREMGPFTVRLNLTPARGGDEELEQEPALSARAMWTASDRFSLGLEAFGEPNARAYYVGPRATVRVGHAAVAVGYLVGFEDALSDSQFRLGLEFTPFRLGRFRSRS